MAANNSVLDQYTVKELEDMGRSFWPDGKALGKEITEAISSREKR